MGKDKMKVISTRHAGVDRLKVLVHGPAGAGKTYLASTTGNHRSTLVLSAEAGLLSLRQFDIKAIEIDSFAALRDTFAWIRAGAPLGGDPESEDTFQWIVLDSISEIALSKMAGSKPSSVNCERIFAAVAFAAKIFGLSFIPGAGQISISKSIILIFSFLNSLKTPS